MLSAVVGVLFEIGKKVIELHDSGADKPILDAIHDIVHKTHGEVDKHHKKHVRGEDAEE